MTKPYSLFIGRWSPVHEGHRQLIQSVLDEGNDVCVAIRDTEISESNPYSVTERADMLTEMFRDEIHQGRVLLWMIPDISEVCYGRKVGWGIREIRLDEQIEAISATQIRKEGKEH